MSEIIIKKIIMRSFLYYNDYFLFTSMVMFALLRLHVIQFVIFNFEIQLLRCVQSTKYFVRKTAVVSIIRYNVMVKTTVRMVRTRKVPYVSFLNHRVQIVTRGVDRRTSVSKKIGGVTELQIVRTMKMKFLVVSLK